ncbi:uncharacterized protein LOC104859472 isoform X1 [Fukomys damarensis]|uniref:uncharacterized protein LOC104859472 isoform X1 n=1 Tax=Fukomys damarensis TaxID=885580 RepID=UPI00053F479F|nr:uncharacterized protein LOC104859472 isoform X1 [Fukomys damarensis]
MPGHLNLLKMAPLAFLKDFPGSPASPLLPSGLLFARLFPLPPGGAFQALPALSCAGLRRIRGQAKGASIAVACLPDLSDPGCPRHLSHEKWQKLGLRPLCSLPALPSGPRLTTPCSSPVPAALPRPVAATNCHRTFLQGHSAGFSLLLSWFWLGAGVCGARGGRTGFGVKPLGLKARSPPPPPPPLRVTARGRPRHSQSTAQYLTGPGDSVSQSLCRELRPNLLSAHGAVEKGKQAQIPGSPGISSKFQVSSLKATDSRAGSTWARACVDQGTRGQEEPGSQENPVPTCWDLATWVRGELTGSPEHLYPALGRV